MDAEIPIKQNIENALKNFDKPPLRAAATTLLNTLGYYSRRIGNDDMDNERFDRLITSALNSAGSAKKRRIEECQSFFHIMQVTDAEINQQRTPEQRALFESSGMDDALRTSYMFVALQLAADTYTRTQLADMTRFLSQAFPQSMLVMFRYGGVLSVAIINRRHPKRASDKQVLEKVTLIKDISLNSPKRAHLDILSDLHLQRLIEKEGVTNFDALHDAWEGFLNTEPLNRKFYRELYHWYEWAVGEEAVRFPTAEKRVLKKEEHVIRLITRILFIWFMKEKGLVADALFAKEKIRELLIEGDFAKGDSYYRVVLQNLFFATLNTEIDKRGFSKAVANTHRNFSRYRYQAEMRDSERLLKLFARTPFINGGLFECLDSFTATGEGGYRIDCFSDKHYHKLSIPNRLFFDESRGLLSLLERYTFTVEEHTPIEHEVALDPELLGSVFENLLAAYNPETGATVRKQTGSYYTPRAIVDYMAEAALVATIAQKCSPTDGDAKLWEERLHYLLDYAQAFDDARDWFDDVEKAAIVRAISELKVLDPAVGSGAFPMGVLHKLTLALRRLDPDNTRWEQLQKERATQRAAAAFDTSDPHERDAELAEISNTFERYRDSDFGRKLYLIQNSIFGVDIQSVACQIAKLRFFISLAIEQTPDSTAENFGIKPLPNLETRFITADTLIGLKAERTLTSQRASDLEQALRANREQHFHATTRQQKRACQHKDTSLRAELAIELKSIGMPADEAEKIAQWNPYDPNATADWFDPEWMFGITQGFDVVIGNPPYIQLQKEGGRLGKLYQAAGFQTFARTGDIYCLFYEKASQLLKNNGHVCFITSNKWMRAGYGKKLRDYFVLCTRPVQLLDMGPGVFDATVDTNILLFQKYVSDSPAVFRGVSLKADFDGQTDNIADYLMENGIDMAMPNKGEPWAILSAAEMNLKRKIEAAGKPLKDWDINIYMGIKTGCNEAFIIDEYKRKALIEQDPKAAEIIKPLLRGRDIQRYCAQWAGLWLIYVRKETAIKDYPSILNHLLQHREALSKKAGKNKWYELQASPSDKLNASFTQEKIVWPDIYRNSSFTAVSNNVYLSNTCYFIPTEETWLCGVLNSKAVEWYYSRLANTLGSGASRGFSIFMKQICVPNIDSDQKFLITNLVNDTLAAKAANPDADTTDLENEIDALVYALYNLTEDEIAIVEANV